MSSSRPSTRSSARPRAWPARTRSCVRSTRSRPSGDAEHAVKLTPERGMEFLLGGVDVALECTGSKSALDLALRTTPRPAAAWWCPGIPAPAPTSRRCGSASWSWSGAYTSGTSASATSTDRRSHGDRPATLPHAGRLVGATYPLDRWREAIDHAHVGRPARHVQGGVRDPRRPEETEHDRCPDPDSCSRSTSGPRRCSSTRARASACRSSRSGTRVVYPPDSLPGRQGRRTRRSARAAAPDRRREPLPELLHARHEAHDRHRRHLAAAAADDARPTSASGSSST